MHHQIWCLFRKVCKRMGRGLIGLSTLSRCTRQTSKWAAPNCWIKMTDADPPTDEKPSSPGEVREAVARLKWEVAAGICNSSAEMVKPGTEAVIYW